MQVPFGSQGVRAWGKIMDTQGISSAVIFIDLANAFHRLVRELVSGIHVPTNVEAVFEALVAEGLPTQTIAEGLNLPCLLEQLHAPPFLVQLMLDLLPFHFLCRKRIGKLRDARGPGPVFATGTYHVHIMFCCSTVDSLMQLG